ncbi:hypothetical protein D9M73_195080 [compost metagenome]
MVRPISVNLLTTWRSTSRGSAKNGSPSSSCMVISSWAVGRFCHGSSDKVPGIGKQIRSASPMSRPRPVLSTVEPLISRANSDAGRLMPFSYTLCRLARSMRLPRTTPFMSEISRSTYCVSGWAWRKSFISLEELAHGVTDVMVYIL